MPTASKARGWRGRLVDLARRPATWGWLLAAASALGAGVSPELRELVIQGLPVLIQALAG